MAMLRSNILARIARGLALSSVLAMTALAGTILPLRAQSGAAGFCAAFPVAEAARRLGVRAIGTDALDDRIGPYRRRLCRVQTEPGETIDLTAWSRLDRRPMGALPARGETCDIGCLTPGREPNLYTYEQRRLGTTLCVIRRPRADRDLATGPITACTASGAERIMLTVARSRGLPPAAMDTVKALLDLAMPARR